MQPGIAALAALRLGQDGFDLVDQRVAFDLELDRGKAERSTENDGAEGHDGDGEQDIHYWYLSRPAKPMKARAIRPAVTMAMATPRKYTGTSAPSMRSRMPANRISTSEKPNALPAAEEQRFNKVVAVGDIEQRHAEHGAVGGDQRQVDAERLLQGRRGLGDDHFGQLDDGRDGDDEGQRAQVFQPEWNEQVVVDDVAGAGGQGQHEGRGGTHAVGCFQFLGNAHEGAKTENLHQHDVVDQHRADEDEEIVAHM